MAKSIFGIANSAELQGRELNGSVTISLQDQEAGITCDDIAIDQCSYQDALSSNVAMAIKNGDANARNAVLCNNYLCEKGKLVVNNKLTYDCRIKKGRNNSWVPGNNCSKYSESHTYHVRPGDKCCDIINDPNGICKDTLNDKWGKDCCNENNSSCERFVRGGSKTCDNMKADDLIKIDCNGKGNFI